MMNRDPRSDLPPGLYRAVVIRSGTTEFKRFTLAIEHLIPGSLEYLEKEGDQEWLDYSLPGCGDWVWQLREGENGVTRGFIEKAVVSGWFEFKKKPFSVAEGIE